MRVVRIGVTLFVLMAIQFDATEASAREFNSDARSLHQLFGEEISTDALEITRRSRQMPPEQRFRYLRDQVLPRGTNQVRIATDFVPTNPSPPVLEKYGSPDLPLINFSGDRRIPSGGVLVSPAIDLVETARELGKLNELRTEVSELSPVQTEQVKARLAILILIEAAEGNRDRYITRVNDFMTLVRESPVSDIDRSPEMVVVWEGAVNAQTRNEIRDFLLLLREQMKFGNYRHRERIKRHVSSLHFLLDEQLVQQGSEGPGPEPLAHWHVVSRDRAATRGSGYPNAYWTATPARTRHVSSHGSDYLYYDIPLRGDYELEGDLSTFGYREIRFAVGTLWAGPLHDLKRITWGDFRGKRPDIQLDPPFAKFGELMRARVVVKDGFRTTYINGRNVFTSPQGLQSDPWVAAMTPWIASGEMQNVRITGNPEIPDEIDLIATSDLPGWLAYYGETVGSSGHTWNLRQSQPTTVIERLNPFRGDVPKVLIGSTSYAPRGSYQESLLRYHRPMTEDGAIEFEFYYSEEQSEVFAALDRCAFVFDRERAGIHWITDGNFDPTGMDPANFTVVANGRPIPLITDSWNQLRLTLKGDAVEVALNGDAILTRELEPENLRTFGLFHYSDQTTAMVRNLRWRGTWPKQLPALEQQELADFSLEAELARGPELHTVFEHDFSQGLPQDRIWVTGHNWQANTEQRANGLWMDRPGGTYEKNNLSLPFGLRGDFDVTWEFENFQADVSETGNGNLHVLILFEDEILTESRLYRKQGFPENRKREQLVQPAIFYSMDDGQTRYTYPVNAVEESTGGKLRIVRRGTTMYFLYAEADSTNFRLIHQQAAPEAPVMFGGIKGIIETHREGETSALWKRVIVKAESVPDTLKTEPLTIEKLDEQRSQLAQEASFELNQKPAAGRLVLTGEPKNVTRESEGWIVRQPGDDSWKATWIKPQIGLQGDFDVTLDLDVLKIEQSQTGSESTVYLHAGFDTDRLLDIEIKYSIAANSPRSLEIQMNTPGRNGGARYEELKHQPADDVTQLRLARRGPFAYLIARRSEQAAQEIFGRVVVGTADVPLDSLGAAVHTGGSGQETIVRFKALQIHAAQFK